MVGMYNDMSYDSYCGAVRDKNGSRFYSSLESARKMIPKDAQQIPFEPEHQFLVRVRDGV